MRAVQIRTFGEPGLVLELADLPEPPAPAAGQVVLRTVKPSGNKSQRAED